MSRIILIATAWGPAFGGVNAFNQELAVGLSTVLAKGRIGCLLPGATQAETDAAATDGIDLFVVPGGKRGDRMNEDLVDQLPDSLKSIITEDLVWVGHDMITGPLAVACARRHGGRVALIHHMHYADYSILHHDDATVDRKAREQKALFVDASEAVLFGVGPLLTDRARQMTGRGVCELVPGFLPGHEAAASGRQADSPIRAITFGRMDANEDRLKNGRLAVAGYATAVRAAADNPVHRERRLLEGSRFTLVGISPDQDTSDLKSAAADRAGRAINLLALPYDEDRRRLTERLAESNLSFMLSWHEGFGLVGWEAIAYGVPLVIGRHSGLYRLIESKLGRAGLALVSTVDIRNPRQAEEDLHPEDLRDVSVIVQRVAHGLPNFLEDAAQLRSMLIERCGCTWTATAHAILSALSWPKGEDASEAGARAPDSSDRTNTRARLRQIILAVYDGSHLQRNYRLTPSWTQLIAMMPDELFGRLRPHISGNPAFDSVMDVTERLGLSAFALASWLGVVRSDWERLHPAVRIRLKRIASDLPEIASLRDPTEDEVRFASTPWRKADRAFAKPAETWRARLRERGIDVESGEIDWAKVAAEPLASRTTVEHGLRTKIQIDVALAEFWLNEDPERLGPAISFRAQQTADEVLGLLRETLMPDTAGWVRETYSILKSAADRLTSDPFKLPSGPGWEDIERRLLEEAGQ